MYKSIYKQIKKYNNIVIARHIKVDPDAMASQTALKKTIELTFPNKKVYEIGTGTVRFNYIGHMDKIPEGLDDCLLISVDTPDLKRLDLGDFKNYTYSIKIDHHPFVESFNGLEYIDVNACSTCEILLDLVNNTKLKINPEIARVLLIGIISDSNRFLFNPVDDKIFFKVGEVIKKYKINIQNIYKDIYMRPMSEIRLMGYIASNLKVTKNKFAYIILENDIVSSFNADASSASNMVNDFSNIEEFVVWLFVTYDTKNQLYKVNIRSRGPIINELASNYNGGGHIYSSGARVKTKEELDNLIIDYDNLCKQYIKENKDN